ncbi:MAG: ATP-binding protein [Ignavibacteriales bacterium]
MEEELLKAQKLESIGVLAGGIAHDFNNLLTAILGNIYLTKITTDSKNDSKMYKRLTEAEKACFRAKDLTQRLLTFSKGGAPVKKVTSIKELIKDSASFAVSGSDVRCEFHISEDLWKVEVDEGQISQVINNVVINAEQAMPEGGVIRVRAENVNVGLGDGLPLKEGKYVRITIEDEGIGIPQEHLPKIFDPYFTTKHSGSGLGLAAVYSIIRSHDGYIGVKSELGAGTKIYIYLSASEKELLAKVDIKEGSVKGRGKVLLMDDEDMVRGVAGGMLNQIGYEVEFARDGREAIELYTRAREENRSFDLVIMDLTIPGGMGGKEAIKRLIDIDPQVMAIVSSGYSSDPVMSEYKDYGFRGVLCKPYSIKDLTAILYTVLNEKKSVII